MSETIHYVPFSEIEGAAIENLIHGESPTIWDTAYGVVNDPRFIESTREKRQTVFKEWILPDSPETTFREMGDKFGVSFERIFEIKQNLVKELSEALTRFNNSEQVNSPYTEPANVQEALRKIISELNSQQSSELNRQDRYAAYQTIFLSRSKEDVAPELGQTPEYLQSLLVSVRLTLWEKLHAQYPQFMSQLAYIPQLDPRGVRSLIDKYGNSIPVEIKSLMEAFFGNNQGKKGLFDLREASRFFESVGNLSYQPEQIKSFLHIALYKLEEENIAEKQREVALQKE